MEKFYVEIPCPEISELLQKKAFEVGYMWVDGSTDISDTKKPYLEFEDLSIGFYPAANPPSSEKYTIEQALKYFSDKKAENENPKFKIGEWVTITHKIDGKWSSGKNWKYYANEIKFPYTGKIEDFEPCYDAVNISGYGFALTNLIENKEIRKATESEIAEATKPRFKAGDRLYCIKEVKMERDGRIEAYEGKIYPVTEANEKSFLFRNESGNEYHGAGSWECGWWSEHFRLATKAEIKAAEKLVINGHTMEQNGDFIEFGCARFQRAQFLRLREFNDYPTTSNRKLKSVTLDSGVVLTIEDINRIIEATK